MRNMLTRAAEIRESEQQQIFDALDEIHARLAPLESIGSVRKRLSEMPDRSETGALAERLDAAIAKLDAQDGAIAALGRAIEAIVDKLATPFAQLDGRLDGVAGRFEGVAGRMDGLEDKLSNIHRRLDELDGHLDKQDGKLDMLPSAVHGPVRERIEQAETNLRGRVDEASEAATRTANESAKVIQAKVDETRTALQGSLDETGKALQGSLDDTRNALQSALDDTRNTVDGTERLEALAKRLEQVTGRLDELTTRLDTVEDGFTARFSELGGNIDQALSKVEGTLAHRPDRDALASMVQKSNEDSVRRIGGHLDEAMATFAELMMGGAGPQMRPPTTLPRQSTRRRTTKPKNGRTPEESGEEPEITEN
ncbi:PA containing protein [Actinophytocola sp.]|uniref:PA containing protein n=1 Tax=Actinophytocola sp. TaxID=1872138 RepID=UPI002D7F8479|nr:PA containing protein [Actinophytocola sp.]HET9142158.1 PA containing protein [Actinophytocola sp.]